MKTLLPVVLCGIVLIVCFVPLKTQPLPDFRRWLDAEHFLLARDNGRQLFRVNARTGREQPYSAPEEASDRLPEGWRATPANSVHAPSHDKLIFIKDQDLFLVRKGRDDARQLTATPAREFNPNFSPDERYVAYTREHNLFVLDLESGLERQLTSDGSALILNGYASWVYYEEILGRATRHQAFYWSPDSRRLAFLRFDDSPVPVFPIFHHEAEDMTHGYLETTRYPKAGDPLPGVRLGVAEVSSGQIHWIETDPELDYLAWIYWSPEGDELLFQQMDREQTMVKIYAAPAGGGPRRLLYEESRPTWVSFFKDLYFLKDKKGIVLRSALGDWENLYLLGWDGAPPQPITRFNWRVTKILAVDEQAGRIIFEGTGEDPTQNHVFSIDLNGEYPRRLTQADGYHNGEVSPSAKYLFDRFSSHDLPGALAVYELASGRLLYELARDTIDQNAHNGIEISFFTVPTADGFALPAYWVLPFGFEAGRQYPVVFDIYGGPDAGRVFKRYRDYSKHPLTTNGVVLFSVDHRGSGKFGKKGLDYMHRNLGKWEMHDYIEAVKWLRRQGFIDPKRVGIQGGSYGGYVTAMALTYGADYFTHGVARASVTDWRLYDNIYTERYMDTPSDNPEGYEFGSVMTHADKLKGRLLLIHGDIDDNVHLQQTIQLASKLQDLGKNFELMIYPGARHGWGGAKGAHAARLTQQFWLRHFFDEEEGAN
jgi:dipeptidyl-peptidase-4